MAMTELKRYTLNEIGSIVKYCRPNLACRFQLEKTIFFVLRRDISARKRKFRPDLAEVFEFSMCSWSVVEPN